MHSFNQYISQPSLYLGRFQPPHLGHEKIINKMNNSTRKIIVVVKGEKSGLDKNRNPLEFEYQEKLLNTIVPEAEVYESKNAFIPSILEFLNIEEDLNVYAGVDRVPSYKDQLKRYEIPNVNLVSVRRDDDNISSTMVRKTIRNGNIESFKSMVPNSIYNEWETLQNKI